MFLTGCATTFPMMPTPSLYAGHGAMPLVDDSSVARRQPSLDLLFIGADGLVSNIAADATPYSEESIPSDGPVVAVLELVGGRAAELGIMPGARVTWDRELALNGR